MNITTESNGSAVVLKLDGRLDTVTAPTLEKLINELPDSVSLLTLRLDGLEYISSAGLRVFLGAQKKMNRNGKLKLTGVCEAVLDILEMTGFADILEIE